MDTVTTAPTDHPAYGSVDYYADLIRRHATDPHQVRVDVLSGIDTAVLSSAHADDTVARVRNALAAGELVLAELQAAGR